MLDLKLFSESMKRMYLLFDKPVNVEQIDAFYDKLKYNQITSLEAAEKKIIEDVKRFPTIGDWVSAFKAVKPQSQQASTLQQINHKCPRCGHEGMNFVSGLISDPTGKVLEDVTFAKCLLPSCSYYRQYLDYTRDLRGL